MSIRRCIWAKGDNTPNWNLVPWCDITCPKMVGGLGIRSARVNNMALLGNLLEDIIRHPHKFWVQVLSQKYLTRETVSEASKKS